RNRQGPGWHRLLMIQTPPEPLARSHERCLRLRQVEAHVDLTIDGRGSSQVFSSFHFVLGPMVELAKSQVAVSDEGAHTEVGGQRVRVTVVGFRLRDTGRIAVRGDLAEEADRMSPHAALASIAGDGSASWARWVASSVRPASRYVSLSEVSNSDW